ncbi:MAG: phosphatidate cytidylyltransferase [Bacteroidales bacterium]
MKDLTIRTITGSIYVITVVVSIIFNSHILAAFFGLINIIALWEFYKNSSKKTIYPLKTLGFIMGIITYSLFLPYFSKYSLFILITLLILAFTTFIIELFRKTDKPFDNIAYTFLGIIYISLPLGLTNWIANPLNEDTGFYPSLLLGIFILAWTNDSFAYLFGVKFGKHRLFERISPKKSWEGFFAGLVFVQIFSIIIYKLSNSPLEFWDWMIIGLIVTVIGTFGDLVESMFKRQIGVKDSGKILPGHGGILDRFDILFIVLPFIYSYIYLRLN